MSTPLAHITTNFVYQPEERICVKIVIPSVGTGSYMITISSPYLLEFFMVATKSPTCKLRTSNHLRIPANQDTMQEMRRGTIRRFFFTKDVVIRGDPLNNYLIVKVYYTFYYAGKLLVMISGN